ncbi:boundary element-associated factor of 32kD isoform X4 [Rhipicephalus microplus]|uniref:boundary element-associated factor of 32kD isoform X4 n=1 Tax=Rhipicephalus microplus TaxID=6941 RepID=UPI003F6D94F0
MLEELRKRRHGHVMSASQSPQPPPFLWGRDPEPKRRRILGAAGSQPPQLVRVATSSPSSWATERSSAPRGRPVLLPKPSFHEEHNRFREMELFMRTTPQPLTMLGGLSSQFLPRIKVELPEPPESPLRRLNTDCGGGGLLSNNFDDSPLDVRIHPRSPNGSAINRCARGSASAGGAPVVDNGEVEEIVANVELADDSTGGDVLEERNNCSPSAATAAAAGARMPYAAAARAVAERQLVELQRLHAEEEHKLKVELLKKQHMVADLQRKYWRMKVKALAQKAASSSYQPNENKSVDEEDSDSPD